VLLRSAPGRRGRRQLYSVSQAKALSDEYLQVLGDPALLILWEAEKAQVLRDRQTVCEIAKRYCIGVYLSSLKARNTL
jgi:hypothetical protein